MLETTLEGKLERYQKLVSKSFYIDNPTLADSEFGDLFFYLPDQFFMMLESSLSLANVKRFGSRDFAIPPQHVQEAFRYVNVHLSEEGDKVLAEYVHGGGRFYGADIDCTFGGARLDQFEVDRSKKAWLQQDLRRFLQQENVGEILALRKDTWSDVVGIQFKSSPVRAENEVERRQPVAYFLTNKPLAAIITGTKKDLLSEAIDEAILGEPFFADSGMVKELRGDRFRYMFSSCIHCGSGLMGARCKKCDVPFEADIYDPWSCAPPRKVVSFLTQRGYTMPENMKYARLHERSAPTSTGPMPSVMISKENDRKE